MKLDLQDNDGCTGTLADILSWKEKHHWQYEWLEALWDHGSDLCALNPRSKASEDHDGPDRNLGQQQVGQDDI